jgi:hypothetical protein
VLDNDQKIENLRSAVVTIHYLDLDDLIAMRRAAGRPKDVRRAAELAALRDENG